MCDGVTMRKYEVSNNTPSFICVDGDDRIMAPKRSFSPFNANMVSECVFCYEMKCTSNPLDHTNKVKKTQNTHNAKFAAKRFG